MAQVIQIGKLKENDVLNDKTKMSYHVRLIYLLMHTYSGPFSRMCYMVICPTKVRNQENNCVSLKVNTRGFVHSSKAKVEALILTTK
ncbi:hypothetical protein EMCRGX_G004791 [Ephydatia muelleri]